MREAVHAGRRRLAAIDQEKAASGLQPRKAAVHERGGTARAPSGLGQHQIDQGRLPFFRPIEQRQPAVAVAQHPQRRRHALDGRGQRRRLLHLARLQQCADFREVLQRPEVGRRTALGVAAVRQHLPADLLGQEAEGAGEKRAMLRHGDAGDDQPLERGQSARVELFGRQRGREAARVGQQPRHQLLAEPVIGGGREEVVMPEPGGDAGADHVGAVGDRLA